MKQFILGEPVNGREAELNAKDYHYIVDVLRLGEGASFRGLLPGGREAELSVVKVDKKARLCRLRVGLIESQGESPDFPKIVLLQALPKGSKLDLIVRQAAECAVDEVVPFISCRSVKRGSSGAARLDRLRRIVREARQQSGSAVDTVVREVMGFEAAMSYCAGLKQQSEAVLFLCFSSGGEVSPALQPPAASSAAPSPGGCAPKTPGGRCGDGLLEKGSLHCYIDESVDIIALFIGPEGGFSAGEEERFALLGAKFVSLGGTVLRCETAALAAVSVVRVLLLERYSWKMESRFAKDWIY